MFIEENVITLNGFQAINRITREVYGDTMFVHKISTRQVIISMMPDDISLFKIYDFTSGIFNIFIMLFSHLWNWVLTGVTFGALNVQISCHPQNNKHLSIPKLSVWLSVEVDIDNTSIIFLTCRELNAIQRLTPGIVSRYHVSIKYRIAEEEMVMENG